MSENTESSNISVFTKEIVELHEFFEEWFAGTCQQDEGYFQKVMGSRFSPAFEIIFASGKRYPKNHLLEQLYKGYGHSPGFTIQIRNVQARFLDKIEQFALVTYEEWGKNAKNAISTNNGRISSVLFQANAFAPNGFEWIHLHECWLPEEVVQAGNFDF